MSQPGPQNWEKEFKKWLGTERIQVFTVASDSRVEKFKEASRLYQVIIISYEMVCSYRICASNDPTFKCADHLKWGRYYAKLWM
jgi:SNF2 family DNA or RNA helicase